jgi:hypothetical protein
MSLPSATITIAYDDDAAGAADALLAVLKQPRTSIEPRDDEKATAEDSAAA